MSNVKFQNYVSRVQIFFSQLGVDVNQNFDPIRPNLTQMKAQPLPKFQPMYIYTYTHQISQNSYVYIICMYKQSENYDG